MTPDADGRIPPVRVPELPWRQVFEVGDRVRVVNSAGLKGLRNQYGTVRLIHPEGSYPIKVVIDDREGAYGFKPGELRRVS